MPDASGLARVSTVGEALIGLLEARGVDTVFGIPGVHTVELYRGLAASPIRHVTPRHEQGAAFMADGFARASGRPGVALLITGPGLTNAITAMAQARADSVPMLVISGVNRLDTLGKGLGYLHELPDQRGMIQKVAVLSMRVETADELSPAVARAFDAFASGRPGPVHIEIPLDIMGKDAGEARHSRQGDDARPPVADAEQIASLAQMAQAAARPLLLAGGGAKGAEAALRAVAERLDAPVVTTANARGLLHRHPLAVHASPSLRAVRALVAEADFVLAVGTEFGPTDYDMYGDGGFAAPANLARIDIDRDQLARHPAAVGIEADCGEALAALAAALGGTAASLGGPQRAQAAAEAAWAEIRPAMRDQVAWVNTIRDTLPGALIVGDSTQPVYAANLWYDHDRPGGWFNAATGYGALGFGPAAAIGAALAKPGVTVVCLTGDGGFQFTLPEIGAAIDANAAVIFVVWNNRGYREIETSMRDVGVEPVGVSPQPPDFLKIAEAYGMPAERISALSDFRAALVRARAHSGPSLIDITVE